MVNDFFVFKVDHFDTACIDVLGSTCAIAVLASEITSLYMMFNQNTPAVLSLQTPLLPLIFA